MALVPNRFLADDAVDARVLDVSQEYDFSAAGIIRVAVPDADDKAANKGYVDSVAQGLDLKASCRVATTGGLPTTPVYDNGLANDGVGATLTAGANASINDGTGIDTITNLAVGDRILVKNQTGADRLQNGIYQVSVVGDSGSAKWVLTRTADCDHGSVSDPKNMTSGAFTFVTDGDANLDTGWVIITKDPISTGVSNIAFTEFSGAGAIAVDNVTIEFNGSTQLAVMENGITSRELDQSDTYDFDYAGGTVRVETQAPGDNSTKAASTAYVDTAVSAINSRIVETFTLDSYDVANEFITLAAVPVTAGAVVLEIAGAPAQFYGVDFEMLTGSDNMKLSWDTLGLDGVLEAGDMLTVTYDA